MAKPDPSKPKFDSFRTSPLIANGGTVDKSAVFRAAKVPLRVLDDDEVLEREMLAPKSDAGDGGDVDETAEDGAQIQDAPGLSQAVTFHLKRNLDKRLDKYLCDRITFMSRSQLQELIGQGQVVVNGRVGKNSTKLKAGDLVTVQVPPPPAEHIAPENIPIVVLLEDEHMLVVNKSPDIIVHPARSEKGGTLINAVAWHVLHGNPPAAGPNAGLSTVGSEFARPGVVHRLDRQTSGVIVFAKSDEAHWKLARQFEQRTTDKRYIAIVHGHVEPDVDVIDIPLGPHHSREKGYREMQVVRHDQLGKPAVSLYRVLGRYTLPSELLPEKIAGHALPGHRVHGGKLSLVEVELKTGRTHQIRVHLQHCGYPLLADDLYGGCILNADGVPLVGRVALHAAMLCIRHPLTNEMMTLIAPLPPDLKNLIVQLRGLDGSVEIANPPGALLTIAALLGT